jgi:hypothetical protein
MKELQYKDDVKKPSVHNLQTYAYSAPDYHSTTKHYIIVSMKEKLAIQLPHIKP